MPQNNLNPKPSGGTTSVINLVAGATQVIKATRGRIGRISIITAGTAGAWSIWDASSAGGAVAASLIWTGAFGNALVAAGAVTAFDWPVLNGIVITVPTSGVASLSFA